MEKHFATFMKNHLQKTDNMTRGIGTDKKIEKVKKS